MSFYHNKYQFAIIVRNILKIKFTLCLTSCYVTVRSNILYKNIIYYIYIQSTLSTFLLITPPLQLWFSSSCFSFHNACTCRCYNSIFYWRFTMDHAAVFNLYLRPLIKARYQVEVQTIQNYTCLRHLLSTFNKTKKKKKVLLIICREWTVISLRGCKKKINFYDLIDVSCRIRLGTSLTSSCYIITHLHCYIWTLWNSTASSAMVQFHILTLPSH